MNSTYHDLLRKLILIYKKHPPFAYIYLKIFALIRESLPFIREKFALIQFRVDSRKLRVILRTSRVNSRKIIFVLYEN